MQILKQKLCRQAECQISEIIWKAIRMTDITIRDAQSVCKKQVSISINALQMCSKYKEDSILSP